MKSPDWSEREHLMTLNWVFPHQRTNQFIQLNHLFPVLACFSTDCKMDNMLMLHHVCRFKFICEYCVSVAILFELQSFKWKGTENIKHSEQKDTKPCAFQGKVKQCHHWWRCTLDIYGHGQTLPATESLPLSWLQHEYFHRTGSSFCGRLQLYKLCRTSLVH